MLLEGIIDWLNSREGIALAGACGIIGGLAVVVALFRFALKGFRRGPEADQLPVSVASRTQKAPRTWWEHLSNDLNLTTRQRNVCGQLYDFGYAQLNYPTNNRESRIEAIQRDLDELSSTLRSDDIIAAQSHGAKLFEASGPEAVEVEAKVSEFAPSVQAYARQHAAILQIEKEKVTDQALGIPLTDFRNVHAALGSNVPVLNVLNELPLAWRMIRTIHDPKPQRRPIVDPPKPRRICLSVETEDGEKRDNEALVDEGWVISDKLGILTPFTRLIDECDFDESGTSQRLIGRCMVLDGPEPPGTESSFWTRGGYADFVLERAARGEDPDTLKRELRKKRTNRVLVMVGTAFLLASILFRIAVELT